MEAVQLGPAFPLQFTFFGRPEVSHDLESGAPPFELDFPVHEDSGGNDYQMWTPYSLLDGKMSQQRDCLNCFS
jgi:hypothetical protein